jgi:hypothetical protein
MNEWASKMSGILDGHVHMRGPSDESAVLSLCEATGIDRMGLVAIQNPEAGAGLPGALYMKARHPARFLVFAGLNHAGIGGHAPIQAAANRDRVPPFRSLPAQADAFVAMGCDGIKMNEGKPTSRQHMPRRGAGPAHRLARERSRGVLGSG